LPFCTSGILTAFLLQLVAVDENPSVQAKLLKLLSQTAVTVNHAAAAGLALQVQ
jgi:hypothetical protein